MNTRIEQRYSVKRIPTTSAVYLNRIQSIPTEAWRGFLIYSQSAISEIREKYFEPNNDIKWRSDGRVYVSQPSELSKQESSKVSFQRRCRLFMYCYMSRVDIGEKDKRDKRCLYRWCERREWAGMFNFLMVDTCSDFAMGSSERKIFRPRIWKGKHNRAKRFFDFP